MNLSEIHRGVKKHKKPRRIGRGTGSGRGKTSGKGHKGHAATAGFSMQPSFQGGQTPLFRRIPKRGFNNQFALTVAVVNVGELETNFEAGEEVTLESLQAKHLAKGRFDELKILGGGELTKKLVVAGHRFSKSAQEKIEKAGGQVNVLPGKTPVAEKQKAARASR
jgi:large subunit ribosomal protein L15